MTSRATLLVLFLVNVLNFYDRQALGAVLEPLRREFHLSDAQLGGLTTAFTLLYAVAGLPLGRLADTGSRRKLLAAGVAVWACLTGLGGLARNYAGLAVTRLGVGVGEAVCAPAATSWLADLVPAARRTRAMAWFMMAVPVGGFLSFSVGGPVAQAFGWRVALAVAALFPLVCCCCSASRARGWLPNRLTSARGSCRRFRLSAGLPFPVPSSTSPSTVFPHLCRPCWRAITG